MQTIEDLTALGPETQLEIFGSLLVVVLVWVGRVVALHVLRHRVEDVRARYRWRKTITYLLSIFGFLIIGWIWFEWIDSLATFLGLLAAGLAVALADPIVNLAGWLFILWRRPFIVGDRIAVGDHAGDVVDARIFQFTLLEIGNWVDADQSTGRIIHVPNAAVFRQPIASYTQAFEYIWNEIPVLVTFESDWIEAKRILREIANKHAESLTQEAERRILEASRRFMIFYKTLTPTVYTTVKESGILLTIRYLCEPRRRRGTAEEIWEDILHEFAKADDIDFAYPTARYFSNVVEGKPGARAAPPG